MKDIIIQTQARLILASFVLLSILVKTTKTNAAANAIKKLSSSLPLARSGVLVGIIPAVAMHLVKMPLHLAQLNFLIIQPLQA